MAREDTVTSPQARPGGFAADLPPPEVGSTPEPSGADREFRLAAAFTRATPAPAFAGGEVPDGPVHTLGVGELLSGYRSGALDPRDVHAALLARIASHPRGGEAVIARVPGAEEAAQESAARWKAGRARPLEGVPFGVKDIVDAAGARVTCGSVFTGDRVAEKDATVVARLREAGAVPFVMTSTTEYAVGSVHNPRYGIVRNPWNSERWTGGSSKGSGSGLAARFFPLALGTDTGGSIRIPSSWCGITGLKPTRGLVPRTGVASLSWTLDHVGPMGRSAADLALAMPHMAGPDGQDELAHGEFDGSRARDGLRGLRVGVPSGWLVEKVDAAVLVAWREALDVMKGEGAILVPVDLGRLGVAWDLGYRIMFCELAALHHGRWDQLDRFDKGLRTRLEQGLAQPATAYIEALRMRSVIQREVLAGMAGVDVVVAPGVGTEAGHISDLTAEVDGVRHPFPDVIARNTMPFDYTGQPALVLPSGLNGNGMPVAIQIIGRFFDEALVLSAGAAFQRVTTHHLNAPPEH
jgi:aspartyl-tRNA(Asn)/glutamyl-tRNA(Gln) amidotransferase subunit A